MNHDIKAVFKKPNGEEIYSIVPRGSILNDYTWLDGAKAEALGINGIPAIFPGNDFSKTPIGINWERFEPKLKAIGSSREEFEALELIDRVPVNVGL